MLNFSSHLQWFQAKIGSYDKQIWETSVEQRILQGLENRPKREGSLHKELIDIDLVRGSTFSKAKPRHGLKSVIFNGLKKVIFFPYYLNQWHDHLNKEVVYFFLFHYIIQLIQLTLYFLWSNSTEIMLEEILLPIVLALSLGVLHAHIIAPYTVKQRRKKTFSTSKSKSSSKAETNINVSKQISDPIIEPSQILEPLQQVGARNSCTCDIVQSNQENTQFIWTPKKGVLFKKSTSELSDDDVINVDKKLIQPEGYDGETETKDSSSSDHEDLNIKEVNDGTSPEINHNESHDPGFTDAYAVPSSKPTVKRVKISESSERSLGYNKMKPSFRKCSQSEVVNVTDEEDLKKFITAKNKHIPDPTPLANIKKDKDKVNWKGLNGTNPKTFKSSKNRRPNIDAVGINSGMSSGSASASNALYNGLSVSDDKKKKLSIADVTCQGANDDSCDIGQPNGSFTNQEVIVDDVSSDQKSTNSSIETLDAKKSSINFAVETFTENIINHSLSQPHTPINHSGSKLRHRIEVRKISSADASPTPSRKTSISFNMSGSLNGDLEQSPNKHTPLTNVTNTQVMQNGCEHSDVFSCLFTQTSSIPDNNISSGECSSKAADLNEDTITKSHKKREEFKQLFVKNAQANNVEKTNSYNSAGKSVSSTCSSRNGASESKHSKVKRRHREDCKMTTGEAFHKKKHRKETVQSMSETEYDRMNSDVNSTGNSTSDGEDICPNVVGTNIKSEKKDVSELQEKYYEENKAIELGANSNASSKNDNIIVTDDVASRPVLSGEFSHPEMTPDDPFILWYKEAHAPGMTGSVSCYIWENDELKKTNLSLLDIGWSIIQAVERHEQDKIYSSFGFFIIIVLCFTPLFFRMYTNRVYLGDVLEMTRHSNIMDVFLPHNGTFIQALIATVNPNTSVALVKENTSQYQTYSWSDDIIPLALTSVLASEWPIRFIIICGIVLRLTLYTMTFLMLSVAQNSFEQRLQYAKHFCRLTSSRRARKYYLPHFRLNKLANIKCWLSLRSYLKKRGPQRSVDSIISSAFYMLLVMLSLVCVNLLQSIDNLFINRLINWDLILCSIALGIFMMRFLVLGTKITKKYRNLSVIITEQINLFLAMQTRPHKKEELTLAHNVLRLAESLLKEVEGPFRICGWSMNPFLYNIVKVVILSVFSTVLSDTCGFKMKLYKIKINPANW